MFVEFDHVAEEFHIIVVHAPDDFKHFIDSPGGDARHLSRALHCMRLTRACLPIGKDADVEAVDGTLDQTLGLIEDLLLGRVGAEDRIENVFALRFPCKGHGELVQDADYIVFGLLPLKFGVAQGPDTAEESDGALHVFELIVQLLPLLLLFFELGGEDLAILFSLFAFLL